MLFTAATDLGDGLVARHFGQTSRLGKILDPLAAKLFLACLLGALVLWRGPSAMAIGDALCPRSGQRIGRRRALLHKGYSPLANRWGKYTTACMDFMALSYILQSPTVLRDGLIGLAAGMVLISSASYAPLVRGLLVPTEQQTSP